MRRAICPGSFDPITLGHLDIIRRAAALFDAVTVCVMVNGGKGGGMFSAQERLEFARLAVAGLDNVDCLRWDGLLADLAAERFDLFLGTVLPLEVTGEQDGVPVGIGKVGELREPMTVEALSKAVKERFGIPAVTVYGSGRVVRRAAISPGSGKSMAKAALLAGADVLITGDMGHHEGLDLLAEGVSLVDAGHYGLEHLFVDAVAEKLEAAGDGLRVVRAPVAYPYQIL